MKNKTERTRAKTKTRMLVVRGKNRVKIEFEGWMPPSAQRNFMQTLARHVAKLFGLITKHSDKTYFYEGIGDGWIIQNPRRTDNQTWLLGQGILLRQVSEIDTPAQRQGFEIRTMRLKFGLSQAALAEKCGIDRTHLSHIERGRCKTRPETLAKILGVLQMPQSHTL